MAVSYIRPADGLPAASKALLVPENIREGIHIKGGGVDVTGTNTMHVVASDAKVIRWNETQSGTAAASYTVKRDCRYMLVIINEVGMKWVTENSQAISKSIPGTPDISTMTSDQHAAFYAGSAVAGQFLSGSISGKTTASGGYLRVIIYTDE